MGRDHWCGDGRVIIPVAGRHSTDRVSRNSIDDKLTVPVAQVIEDALAFVPAERLFPCTNCGMAPMPVDVAAAKLVALGQGAALVRRRRGA